MKEIPREKSLQRLRAENPWWRSGEVDTFFRAMTRRAYFDIFTMLVEQRSVRRAVVLMGPRRVGKTVLLHHVMQSLIDEGVRPSHIAFISVDNPLYNGLSLEELLALCREASPDRALEFAFFDEIQYLRDWERHLKVLVDGERDVRFVVSGSAAAALRLKSYESGAGRFTNFLLPPLTFHEALLLGGHDSLVDRAQPGFARTGDIARLNERFIDYLNFGGYPEAIVSPQIRADPGRFIKSDIIDKVLLRDLPSLYGIQDIQELNHLFTSLAYNTAQEVSLEALSKNSGVAKNTIKRYIEYLEAAFLLRRVSRVDRDARTFKRQPAFKVYLTNPSIRAALFAPVEADDPDVGHLVETAMYSQWFHGEEVSHHYARWDDGEVDMVYLEGDGKPGWVAEAKWSDRPVASARRELEPLIWFCRKHELREALVTTRTGTGTHSVDGIRLRFVPASLYCYTIGYNVSRGRRQVLETLLAESPAQKDDEP